MAFGTSSGALTLLEAVVESAGFVVGPPTAKRRSEHSCQVDLVNVQHEFHSYGSIYVTDTFHCSFNLKGNSTSRDASQLLVVEPLMRTLRRTSSADYFVSHDMNAAPNDTSNDSEAILTVQIGHTERA